MQWKILKFRQFLNSRKSKHALSRSRLNIGKLEYGSKSPLKLDSESNFSKKSAKPMSNHLMNEEKIDTTEIARKMVSEVEFLEC